MRRLIIMFGSVIYMAAFSPISSTSLEEDQRKSLSGIDYLMVNVTPVEELETDGLFDRQLRTDAEISLRKAGIMIVSEIDSTTDFAHLALLDIIVDALKLKKGKVLPVAMYIFNIRVTVGQFAYLERNLEESLYMTTWRNSYICSIAADKMPSTIRQYSRDLVDMFINDYLAANSKVENKR